ncbi:MAG: PAS domain S-box protein [Phycisphaerae bacterium]|nr:PAS domain S-box protein [Phycisphaerae bacterium]
MTDQRKKADESSAQMAWLQQRRTVADAEPPVSPRDRLPSDTTQSAPTEAVTSRASYAERLLDALPEAISMTDLEGRICYVNRAFLKNSGLHAEQVIGKTFPETHLVDTERFTRLHQRMLPLLMAEGTVQEVEALAVNLDGSQSAVLVDLTLLRDEADRPSHIVAVVRDTTALEAAESSLIESERRYREIVETVGDLIVTFDVDGRVRSVNHAVKTMLGFEAEQVVGRPGSLLVLPEHQQDVMSQVEHVLRGHSVRSETVLVDRENRCVYVEYSAGPLAEHGRIVGGRCIAWDITKRKRLERQLKASEERYRALVESAGETIATVDEDGRFLFMNNTAAQRLGGRAEDFIGKTMWDLFPPAVADFQAADIQQVIRTGEGRNTVSLSCVGGEMRWYNTTIQPLRDSEGNVTAGLIIARDIHEFKKAQDELAAYSERMIRAEQLASLGTLSATLSHELTQPLTVIRLSIQNSLNDLEKMPCPPRVVEDLRDGLAEVASVTAIAERFRSFARRSSEKATRETSVAETAARVMRLLQESARRAKVALEMQGLDALPAVCIHEKDLEQLFFALAQNAIQAADGQRSRRLTILGRREGELVALECSDDCGGIAPQCLPHIFEPFFTTKPAGEGTGLGLCIAERVVAQARGQMSVESHHGSGTTFRVSLPISGA